METKQQPSKRFCGKLPLSIIILLITILISVIFLGGYIFNVKRNYIFSLNIQVEAVLIDDIDLYGSTRFREFCNIYFFEKDGYKYSGTVTRGYRTRPEAEKHIGEKVLIYIDGKGNSAMGNGNQQKGIEVYLVVSIILFLGAIAIFIVLCLPHRWKPKPKGKSRWVKYNP